MTVLPDQPTNPYPTATPAQLRLQVVAAIELAKDLPADDPRGWLSDIAARFGMALDTVHQLAFEPNVTALCGSCVGRSGEPCGACGGKGWMRTIATWLGALLLALLPMLAAPGAPALAHSWYDGNCCSERDCGPVPVRFNLETGQVEILHGQWYGLQDLRAEKPAPRFLPSQDAAYHACWSTYLLRFRCIYLPPGV